VIRRLLRTLALAARTTRRGPSGGALPPYRPDPGRIAILERELGLVLVEPERPIRRGPKVCLTKDCMGDTTDVHTWGGQLAVRIHTCEAP
jgi:hypothetical protein